MGCSRALTRQVLQSALEVEMSHHLGFDRGDRAGRNGELPQRVDPKTVTTEIGKVTVEVPA
jgi:transposase-like protein